MGFVSTGKQNPDHVRDQTFGHRDVRRQIILDRSATAQTWLEFSYGYAIYGAMVGVVMAHFVLDAGIWRLREPFQRGYMRKKFYFIFNR